VVYFSSKTLITSREYSRAFRNNTNVVDLRGMTSTEATEYIQQRLHSLKLHNLITNLEQLNPLLAVTGGNPKAIGMALGCIKYERRPLQQVVEDLYAARSDIFDDLFIRCWSLLDEAARRVLLSMVFFVDSASKEALSITADTAGFVFDRSLDRLTDLSLIEVQQVKLESQPRYLIHSLVRVFAKIKLIEHSSFEESARRRWLNWYITLAQKVGYSYYDLSKLSILDAELENTYFVTQWSVQNKLHESVIQLCKGIDYYLYVRGFWDKDLVICNIYADAARASDNICEETLAISQQLVVLYFQDKHEEAEKLLPSFQSLISTAQLPSDSLYEVHSPLAYYKIFQKDFDSAQFIWEGLLKNINSLPLYTRPSVRVNLADCLAHKGQLIQARHLLLEALKIANEISYHRAVIWIEINLANNWLLCAQLEEAERFIISSREKIYKYQEGSLLAILEYVFGHFYILSDDLENAGHALSKAVELFKRLGTRDNFVRANEQLALVKNLVLSETKDEKANVLRM